MSETLNGSSSATERMYTLREVREAERAAFLAGFACPVVSNASAEGEAKRRYPITRKVPRVELVGNFKAEVDGLGRVIVTNRIASDGSGYVFTPDEVNALAEIVANPMKEVEE